MVIISLKYGNFNNCKKTTKLNTIARKQHLLLKKIQNCKKKKNEIKINCNSEIKIKI